MSLLPSCNLVLVVLDRPICECLAGIWHFPQVNRTIETTAEKHLVYTNLLIIFNSSIVLLMWYLRLRCGANWKDRSCVTSQCHIWLEQISWLKLLLILKYVSQLTQIPNLEGAVLRCRHKSRRIRHKVQRPNHVHVRSQRAYRFELEMRAMSHRLKICLSLTQCGSSIVRLLLLLLHVLKWWVCSVLLRARKIQSWLRQYLMRTRLLE